jgi:CRISPR system Cascade subunit CasD
VKALVLRLEGPLQSWGGPTAGDDRPTLEFPTKSGVIGLAASALGLRRAQIAALVDLHQRFALGLRIDRPGVRTVDFQTIQDVPTKEGKLRADPVVSSRGYIADASFVALLMERYPGTPSLDEMTSALRFPAFAPFLGRRSCPPSVPILASPPTVEAESWAGLFEQVDAEPGRPSPLDDATAVSHDLFVEGDPQAPVVRQLRFRTTLTGPLPRQFAETRLFHLRSRVPLAQENTVDPWFKQ